MPLTIKSRNRGTRKKINFTIKPFEPPVQRSDDILETSWKKLLLSIEAIQTHVQIDQSQEELYKSVSELCEHHFQEELYNRLKKVIKERLKVVLEVLESLEGDLFVTRMRKEWEYFCRGMIDIRNIFLVLDRTWVYSRNDPIRSLWDLGLQLWRNHVVEVDTVQERLVVKILALILKQREGDDVDTDLLKVLLKMFHELQLYEKIFENRFLHESKLYYEKLGKIKIDEYDVPHFLEWVFNCLNNERKRCYQYLQKSTNRPLIRIVEKYCVGNFATRILESEGFLLLLKSKDLQKLKDCYQLLGRVNHLETLRVTFKNYLTHVGQKIVKDPEGDDQMVEKLFELKKDSDDILEFSFEKNDDFRKNALKDAFNAIINSRNNVPAEMIAKFVHKKMIKSNKATEEELEEIMESVMALFRFIQHVDVFEAFYKKDFAKRLLLNKSISLESEKSMISKLKHECGKNFTSKLEGMLKDMESGDKLLSQFQESDEKKRLSVDFQVRVLSKSYWPPYPVLDITLPQFVLENQSIFTEFYDRVNTGRKLYWLHQLGRVQMVARFPKCDSERMVSTSIFQAVILEMYNRKDEYTFEEIEKSTGMVQVELKRTLHELSGMKTKVLIKETSPESDDKYVFNTAFTTKKRKFKLDAAQLKETRQEKKELEHKIQMERCYMIDAAVVKIMKARKELFHLELITELWKHLNFQCDKLMVKKQIEKLIERGFIERTENGGYLYIA